MPSTIRPYGIQGRPVGLGEAPPCLRCYRDKILLHIPHPAAITFRSTIEWTTASCLTYCRRVPTSFLAVWHSNMRNTDSSLELSEVAWEWMDCGLTHAQSSEKGHVNISGNRGVVPTSVADWLSPADGQTQSKILSVKSQICTLKFFKQFQNWHKDIQSEPYG